VIRLLRAIPIGAMMLVVLLTFDVPARADSNTPRPEFESYLLHCSGCHRADGRGVPGVAPDLREIGVFLGSEAGRAYLGRVPGVAQAPVGDQELAMLLNWVLTEIAGTTPDPVYSASEIGALRAKPLRDPLTARRRLFPENQ
jgi:mono/diheme cytochrome c family protein